MANQDSLNRTELQNATGVPAYIILYLKDCGRLPIVQESKGRGYSTLYHPDAIEVVKEHLSKGNKRHD
tara:strand:- start:125 stop:328 length:204 start_codon:yes stop_codon:yes gene_type:complete